MMEQLLTLYERSNGGNDLPVRHHGPLQWLQGNFIDNIQLDIVGFLAILGEGSISANLQVSTLSKLIFIPRLIPAPQVFFRPTRDSKLEPSPGNVTGVYSGNDKDFVNYLGHVVLDAEDMPDYSVRCISIEKTNRNAKIKAQTKGPLSLLSLLGAAESVAILGVAIWNRDGFAVLAVVLFSFLSSLAGWANYWNLELPKRRKMASKPKGKVPGAPTIKMDPPPGDVVVRYPKGSFLVVQCSEDVARELYFAPENIYYTVESPWMYRIMSLIGTLMLMMGIVALGNAGQTEQIIFAACYMALNSAYWLVAALPPKAHWDMSMYQIRKQRIVSDYQPILEEDECSDKDVLKSESREERKVRAKAVKEEARLKAMAAKTYTDLNLNFTWAMWKTIVATESVAWVKKNDALPETPVWNEWLQDALKEAKKRQVYFTDPSSDDPAHPSYKVKNFSVPDWDPQAHFYELLNKHQGGEAEKPKVTRNERIEPGPPSKRTTQISEFEKDGPRSPVEPPLPEAVTQHGDIGDIGIPISTARQPTS